MFEIASDDPTSADIAALIAFHLGEMRRHSPACSVHAMPAERLREADVTFFALRIEGRLAGCGALKELDATHGELKSMRVADEFRGRGLGEALLLRLMAEATERGYIRLSLETGRPEPFQAAQALYRKHGFVECPPFAGYIEDPFSMCMTRTL